MEEHKGFIIKDLEYGGYFKEDKFFTHDKEKAFVFNSIIKASRVIIDLKKTYNDRNFETTRR